MTSNALTNEEKHVTPYRACARSQQYTKVSVFGLAINDVMLYDITYCPAFFRLNFGRSDKGKSKSHLFNILFCL